MEKINYLLPEESAEMTLNQVKSLRQIEDRLRKLFGLKNYQEVMPPSFEYTQLYTALESNGKTFNQEKMFQFINHEGQSITLRYDFTLPLVRLYSQIKDSTVLVIHILEKYLEKKNGIKVVQRKIIRLVLNFLVNQPISQN
ncbi:ATP phosphoribosyltransferase regulatory subunit [Lactococcus lactis]|uniref:ATP phosphoribosyltransferase regulatory subunit n=1 Tax=Lactococcus lactis TaxID=1358 RepID=A0AAP4DSN4_9LACT|nr:ATP phosphoribosyltransferase regulatory subunit [Lactococcus lactis]MDG4967623.1 ATP phosphoribosyltransferase regulatory subunit [Lactococcus lactis]MDG4975168.1 ATP phosphoribosyltransferase regulatory subunit [Lactococcus lactis]MDG5101887.1 ATP phosphoribosyltransferase regulatory subunit [Lactococcus lactis]